jgi:hypothetical protein
LVKKLREVTLFVYYSNAVSALFLGERFSAQVISGNNKTGKQEYSRVCYKPFFVIVIKIDTALLKHII